MAGRVYVRDIEILQNLQTELSQFNYGTNKVLSDVARSLAETKEYLGSRAGYWNAELRKREDVLRACLANDDENRDCRKEDMAVQQAREALEKLRKLKIRLEQADGEYQPHATRLQQLVNSKTSKAKGDLQGSIQKYQSYLSGTGLTSGGKNQNLSASRATAIHHHHIYPKFRGNEKYSQFFENLGINVDDWTVAVDEKTHLKYIHGEAKWNDVWKAWIDEHEGEVTAEEVLKFGRESMTFFGIEGLWEGDANPDPTGYEVPDNEIFMRPKPRGGSSNE